MIMPNNERFASQNTTQTPQSKKGLVMVCMFIFLAGVVGAVTLVKTAPRAQKRPPAKMSPLVTVQKVYPETRQVVIQAMGTVVPDKELTLKARVAGEIIYLHPEFTEGGLIRQGELMLQVDDLDYELMVAQKQSAVADARYALKLELGRQDVARREWELLNGGNPAFEADAELALRKPHLEKARSDLKAAKAELEAAQLQLKRTKIHAPFNAVIRQTHVEKGSHVAAHEALATLAGTDTYWVQVSIPVDRLKWLSIADNCQNAGALSQIHYNGGAVRTGRVMKLLSDLETEGRMARLLIAVDDPLNLKNPQSTAPAILIGEYVRVQIDGHPIQDAFQIPRTALRDNTHIWVVGAENKLEIRDIKTIWRDTQSVILTDGLQAGDQVIVSDLAAPVPGMTVMIENEDLAPIQPTANEDSRPEKS